MSPFDTSPASKLQTIAEAIARAFDGIDGATCYPFEPLGDEEIPDAFVGVADVETSRTDPLEAETRLGRVDWDDDWTVRIYVRVYDSAAAWALARSLVGQVRDAIDLDWQLGDEVSAAAVVSADIAPAEAVEQRPRQIIAECVVAVKYLMPDNR